MMTRLDIRLLGEFVISNNGVPLNTLRSLRQQCLLAYLLLHRDAPVERRHLAYLFWPDFTEEQALANLRNLLHTLGKTLPNGDHFIQTDGMTAQWRADSPYTLDVDVILALLSDAHGPEDVQRAIDLYRGQLFPSCYDDWIAPEREQLEQKVTDKVQRFIDGWEREGAYRAAIHFARWLVHRDPLREGLYRQIMRLYALSGDRAGVAHIFRECQEALKREAGDPRIEPSLRTQRAFEKYMRMESRPQAASAMSSRSWFRLSRDYRQKAIQPSMTRFALPSLIWSESKPRMSWQTKRACTASCFYPMVRTWSRQPQYSCRRLPGSFDLVLTTARASAGRRGGGGDLVPGVPGFRPQ